MGSSSTSLGIHAGRAGVFANRTLYSCWVGDGRCEQGVRGVRLVCATEWAACPAVGLSPCEHELFSTPPRHPQEAI